ncbi:MAG TPA: uracil phosphoribosyltransferase [Nitrososphaerales archaeon]|nr:uracil phosphoribosyltransferase [Nitrososphaerales archaeon]
MGRPRITIVEHPMALEQLTLARDRRSDQVIFRKAIFRLGRMLAYEFLRTLETKEVHIETPMEKSRGKKIKGNDKIVIVMVLRASIPFVEGMYKMLPMARTGIISAWRGDPPEFRIEVSYAKLPTIHEDDIVIIADPMLATGHTLLEVANRVMARGKPKRLVFFSVISARQGINYVSKVYPNAEFYTCAVDRKLDEQGYIVPGLGDAGDRAFGSPY